MSVVGGRGIARVTGRGVSLLALVLVPSVGAGQSGGEAVAPSAAIAISLEAPAGAVHVGDPLEIVAHVELREGALLVEVLSR